MATFWSENAPGDLGSLAPGTQFQFLYVTEGTTTATSSDINYYNGFVNADAAANVNYLSYFGIDTAGLTWSAVCSTPTVSASANAPSAYPVYDLDGDLLANPNSLYTAPLLTVDPYGGFNSSGLDEFGSAEYNDVYQDDVYQPSVWTGVTTYDDDHYNGGVPIGYQLGSRYAAAVGLPYGATSFEDYDDAEVNGVYQWLDSTNAGAPNGAQDDWLPKSTLLPLYALSSPITVPVPEPSTFVLLGSALLLMGGHRFLRRRRGAGRVTVAD
jgi:hypothetical protein